MSIKIQRLHLRVVYGLNTNDQTRNKNHGNTPLPSQEILYQLLSGTLQISVGTLSR